MSLTFISARINSKIKLQYHWYQYWICTKTKSFNHFWHHVVGGASKL